MIYGKFQYILDSNNALNGINSVLDPLPVKNSNFAQQGEWGYCMIDGDISNYDLSLFQFVEITQEEALTIQKSIYPDAILLENGTFGFTSRMNEEQTTINNLTDEEKMLDPAKWGLNY